MAKESFWGTMPNVENVRTPTKILKEQAAALSELSNRLLEGHVEKEILSPSSVQARLMIVAPSLGGFEVYIASIRHGLEMYPLRLSDNVRGGNMDAINEKDFEEKLKAILSSEPVRKVITSLLLQLKS